MIAEVIGTSLPVGFRRYPGAVLQISAAGLVLDSNGRLEDELGEEIQGHAFDELLDRGSSRAKWRSILQRTREGAETDVTCELSLAGTDSVPEPRSFVVVPDPASGIVWLLEQSPDPRLDRLREQVEGVNSDLARAQRELIKERGRLAATLDQVEELYARSEALALRVQEQNRELVRSNQALDEFAHVVSHDLRAPLRAIENYAAWLREDLGDQIPEESLEQLDRLRDRAEHLRSMIEGVLEYARVVRMEVEPESVDVGELIAHVVQLVDPPPGTEVVLHGEFPVLSTERSPLQQIFLNLTSNAVRYAGPEARVELSAERRGGFWEFAVADDGPGIPPEVQDRIWLLFQTLQAGDAEGGSGIGLAVVRKLVEGHGGRIWVESEVGRGTTFRFLWPADPGPQAAKQPSNPE